MEGRRVAAIDIGSNAMRLLIAEEVEGKLRTIENDRGAVRLGADVFNSGTLSDNTISRAVQVIKSFKSKIESFGVAKYRAVGTSAMREASNGLQLIEKIRGETGVEVEVIDGEEEARLVYVAISEAIIFTRGVEVLVDIGGGSVEVTIVQAGSILFSESFKMGSVRLIGLFDSGKVSARTFQRMVREYSRGIKSKLSEQIGERPVERCVGTGGNLDTLLELRQQFFKKRGNQIERSELEEILERLQDLSVTERIEKFGLRPDRADVIVPAAIVMLHIMKAAQAPVLLVPEVGVKEGLAYELFQDVRELDPHFFGNNLRDAAVALGRKYHFEEAHALCVSRLALQLFDQTTNLHNLDVEGRKLLEVAGLLHDIGHFISSQGHHKHSFYLIESASLPGLTKKEKLLIACVARYHRKKFPDENHPGYSELKKEERKVVSQLAALLRLADGLDREHRQLVQQVNVQVAKRNSQSEQNPNKLVLSLEGDGDLLLDRWSVKLKSDLFAYVFGMEVEISELK